MIQPIAACAFDTFDMYKDTIHELGRDPSTRKMQGGENDVDDLSGCPILIEIGKWKKNNARNIYERHAALVESSGIISSGYDYIDSNQNKFSTKIITNRSYRPVYIGPWHPITLTHTEGSFFSKKKITEEKQIRFFAYQKTEGGPIQYQYESMNDANKNIPAKPFGLSPSGKIAPDKFSLCAVKWVAKYGYNAVYDQKTKKIIETKE